MKITRKQFFTFIVAAGAVSVVPGLDHCKCGQMAGAIIDGEHGGRACFECASASEMNYHLFTIGLRTEP
jgi:hypothetical protein